MRTVMMMLFGAALLVLGSCSLVTSSQDKADSEYMEAPSPVLSQNVATKGGASVTFMLKASWGSSCGSFSRAEVGRSGSEYTIKIYGRQLKSAVCLTVMSSYDVPLTIDLPSPGAYRFKFWQSDTSNIDTMFVIK